MTSLSQMRKKILELERLVRAMSSKQTVGIYTSNTTAGVIHRPIKSRELGQWREQQICIDGDDNWYIRIWATAPYRKDA